jgi:hypothetical protein
VTLHAGGLIGLPAGVPNVTYDIACWRDLLVVVGLAAAACEARARRRAALGLGLLFMILAVGFWVAALARPYGVLDDPGITRWAADVSVAGWSGGDEGFVVGEPSKAGPWAALACRMGPDVVLLLPTVWPVLLLPAVALVIAGGWGRPEATLAAILWVAGGTGALETLRGVGFLPGLWARPGPSLLWLAALAVILVASRRLRRGDALVAAAVVAGWMAMGRRWPALGPADALMAITLDHHVWLVAGIAGLRRERDRAAMALVAVGALLALSRGFGGPGDVWAGAAFVRTGLVLGAALWLDRVSARLVSGLSDPARRMLDHWKFQPPRVLTGLALAVLLTGSFLAWWDPARIDPVAKAGLEPVPDALVEAMGWIREHTRREAAVLAHDDYAAAVAVLGGRRVLRAPGLVSPVDDERRLRLERAVFAGDPPATLRQRYGLRYVFVAPGQFREHGMDEPEDLERTGTVRLVYANAKGMRLYEIAAAHADAPAGAFK